MMYLCVHIYYERSLVFNPESMKNAFQRVGHAQGWCHICRQCFFFSLHVKCRGGLYCLNTPNRRPSVADMS